MQHLEDTLDTAEYLIDFCSFLPSSPPNTRSFGCNCAAQYCRRHVARVAAQDGRRALLTQTLTATAAAGDNGRTHICLAKEKKMPHEAPAVPLQVEEGSRG